MSGEQQDYESILAQLAERLAKLRRHAGLTGEVLATKLGVTQASVSRIETARQRPNLATVRRWMQATRASQNERIKVEQLLEDLAHEYTSTKVRLARGVSANQAAVLQREAAYDHIRVAQPAVVPGLLQTPDYARSIFGLGPRKHTPIEINKSVQKRAERQAMLFDDQRQFDFLIFEQALWATCADKNVMVDQFQHLERLASRNNVWIGIVPLGTRLSSIPIVAFEVYGDELVTIETLTGIVTVQDPPQVETYVNQFKEWALLAVNKELSPWLRKFMRRYTAIR